MMTTTGHCQRCGAPYHFHIPRGFVLRYLLFFLPVRKYFCAKCLKVRWTWDKHYRA